MNHTYGRNTFGARIDGIHRQIGIDIDAMRRLNAVNGIRCRNLSLAITEAENARFRLEEAAREIPEEEQMKPERYE